MCILYTCYDFTVVRPFLGCSSTHFIDAGAIACDLPLHFRNCVHVSKFEYVKIDLEHSYHKDVYVGRRHCTLCGCDRFSRVYVFPGTFKVGSTFLSTYDRKRHEDFLDYIGCPKPQLLADMDDVLGSRAKVAIINVDNERIPITIGCFLYGHCRRCEFCWRYVHGFFVCYLDDPYGDTDDKIIISKVHESIGQPAFEFASEDFPCLSNPSTSDRRCKNARVSGELYSKALKSVPETASLIRKVDIRVSTLGDFVNGKSLSSPGTCEDSQSDKQKKRRRKFRPINYDEKWFNATATTYTND